MKFVRALGSVIVAAAFAASVITVGSVTGRRDVAPQAVLHDMSVPDVYHDMSVPDVIHDM